MKSISKVLFYPAICLDGFIAKLDCDSNWVTEEDEQIFAQEVQRACWFIVGRKAFEQYRDCMWVAGFGKAKFAQFKNSQLRSRGLQYI